MCLNKSRVFENWPVNDSTNVNLQVAVVSKLLFLHLNQVQVLIVHSKQTHAALEDTKQVSALLTAIFNRTTWTEENHSRWQELIKLKCTKKQIQQICRDELRCVLYVENPPKTLLYCDANCDCNWLTNALWTENSIYFLVYYKVSTFYAHWCLSGYNCREWHSWTVSYRRRRGDSLQWQETMGWLESCLFPLYPLWWLDDLVWNSAALNATDRHSEKHLESKHPLTHRWK